MFVEVMQLSYMTRLSGEDPFLVFLANDIEQFPEHLRVLNEDAVKRLQILVGGVDIDLNVPLSAENE